MKSICILPRTSKENIAQKTMNRSRAINGRKNNPTWTEPAENSHTTTAADDIYMNQVVLIHLVADWNSEAFRTHHKQYSNDSGWRFQRPEITVQWNTPWYGWHLDGICKIGMRIPEIIFRIIIYAATVSLPFGFTIPSILLFFFPLRFRNDLVA